MEANKFLPSPLKQDVPHSSDLLLFLIGLFFLFCSGSLSLKCPFTLKAAEFSVCRAAQSPLVIE